MTIAEIYQQFIADMHNTRWFEYVAVFATATGIFRMYNNKHWLSDVIAGAGFGILSTKASYWIFEKVKSKKQRKKNISTIM